jgi:hypothetical protein
LNFDVATLRIILNGGATTTTSGVVKWYDSIATYQNLTKTTVKTLWALETLHLHVALVS